MERGFKFFMFNDINKVIIIGRLGADPEIRYISDGVAVLSFNVATSMSKKDLKTGVFTKKTEWLRVVLYGSFAETARDYLKKGNKVYIEGSFRTVKTQSKEYVEIIASILRLLSGDFKVDHFDSNASNENQNDKNNYIPF